MISLDISDNPIKGLFACGELVGGVFLMDILVGQA